MKYLELHEGKEIPNTLGDFFKKCLDSSKFLKKSIPKETAEPAVKDSIEPQLETIEPPSNTTEPPPTTTEPPAKPTELPAKTTEPPAKTNEPTVSLGFQEQFLNSLSKLGSENTDLLMEDETDNNKSDDNVEKEEKVTTVEEKETTVEEKELDKMEVSYDDEVNIIETVSESVICISDSEEEKDTKESGGNYAYYNVALYFLYHLKTVLACSNLAMND